LAHGSSQTQPDGVATHDSPVGQVPLHVGGEVLAHGSSQTQPEGVATQDSPVGQVPLHVGGEVRAQGSAQTRAEGVATQDSPVGQVPLQVGGEVLAHGSSQTQPEGVATQDSPVGQVPLQVGALPAHGGMQTLPGKVSGTGRSVPSSMPAARARSVSGLVSLASTVRSGPTQVSLGAQVTHIGGRHSASVMQNSLAVALQCGWNGTLTASLA